MLGSCRGERERERERVRERLEIGPSMEDTHIPNTPNRNSNCIRLQLSTTLTNPKLPQPPPLLPSTMTVAATPPQALPHPPSLLDALPSSTQNPPQSLPLRRPGVLVCPERAVKSESSIVRASNEIRIDRWEWLSCGVVEEGEGRGLGDWKMGRALWRRGRLGEGGTVVAAGGEQLVMAGEP
ncbi:Transmembrane protein [Actinidia chinensis var. chinensis]|uniref:Transmembrane protein n=1 Tax=Actinidia chinensis var. chinensis TaxID=1590841 RepID=A0A2R6PVY9_ACTCC|nr:Transmembrane protein [Actinidia chinensis var. chinensis]